MHPIRSNTTQPVNFNSISTFVVLKLHLKINSLGTQCRNPEIHSHIIRDIAWVTTMEKDQEKAETRLGK